MHFLPQLEHQEVARRTDQRGSKEGEADLQAYKKIDELNLRDLAKMQETCINRPDLAFPVKSRRDIERERVKSLALQGEITCFATQIPQHQTTADHEWQGD